MAWKVVKEIRNALNTYTFATFPLKNYAGNAGGTFTNIYVGGAREYNDDRMSEAYAEGIAFINNLLSQGVDSLRGKFSYSESNYTSYDKYVYGNNGGDALRLQTTIANNDHRGYGNMAWRILNFSSTALNGSSGSYGADDGLTETSITTFGLVMNEEEEKIYCAEIIMAKAYYNVDHSPAYYDRAAGFIRVWDGLSNSNLWQVFSASVPHAIGPYDGGGTSTTGGGENATYDDTSDEIDVPSIPLLNLTFSGFMSAYAPTLQQVQDLASYVWSDWDSGNFLNKLFANVADAIISLHMLPFSPSASTTPADVMVGLYDSGVDMYPLNAQFNDVDCGSLQIPLYWDNYLDYNPYTKLTLFLPYVGEVTLNPDEVMGETIGIKYRVDALTGAFVCFITRSDHKIIGQYQGNCALSVPLSSANYAQLHAAMLTIATAAVGAAAATGGAVAGLAAGGEAGIEAALGVMDTKVKHNVSGALGSAAGFMGSQKPYLIIERARQCLPEDLGKFTGYPSQITETLGSLTGFTQVENIILDGIPLTETELEELRGILAEGVIL